MYVLGIPHIFGGSIIQELKWIKSLQNVFECGRIVQRKIKNLILVVQKHKNKKETKNVKFFGGGVKKPVLKYDKYTRTLQREEDSRF